jgi:hypothetical protein
MRVIQRAGLRPATAFAFALTASALAMAVPQAASADNIYGSGAIFTSRPCTATPDQLCNVAGTPRTFTQFAGGYGQGLNTFAAISTGETAQGYVNFGAGYLPTLGIGSDSGAATRTGATLTGFQSFTYTGAFDIDLALKASLHYIQSGDLVDGDAIGEGGLNVSLGIMSLAQFAALGPGATGADIVNSISTNFPVCGADGVAAATDYNSGGQGAGEYRVDVGLATSCSGGKITLHNGDSFVVVATMQAISNRNGFLDATHTFAVDLDTEHTFLAGTDTVVDAAVLRASIDNSIPEPGTWAMMILGAGLAGTALRRRRVITAA